MVLKEQNRWFFAVLLAVLSNIFLFRNPNNPGTAGSWSADAIWSSKNIIRVMCQRIRKNTNSLFLMDSKCLLFMFCDLEKHLNVVQKTSVNKIPQTQYHIYICIQAFQTRTGMKYEMKEQSLAKNCRSWWKGAATAALCRQSVDCFRNAKTFFEF